jgi:hypothetical protein
MIPNGDHAEDWEVSVIMEDHGIRPLPAPRQVKIEDYKDELHSKEAGHGLELNSVRNLPLFASRHFKFPSLLSGSPATRLPHDLRLSPHKDEVLAVKLEVDSHPPQGAGLETSLVRRYVMLNLHHHDRASLLAGKIHTLLQRPYLKGRDLYDLIWYLSTPDWPAPNLTLLNNALVQTGWRGPRQTPETWRETLHARLREIPWGKALTDVEPFLLSQQETDLLTKENLDRLLSGR